jgi:hypothetical protein
VHACRCDTCHRATCALRRTLEAHARSGKDVAVFAKQLLTKMEVLGP